MDLPTRVNMMLRNIRCDRRLLLLTSMVLFVALAAFSTDIAVGADGPDDNQPTKVRQVPPKGIPLNPNLRQAMVKKCDELRTSGGQELAGREFDRAQVMGLVRAVEMTISEEMFYSDQEIQIAQELLDQAASRLDKARQGVTGADLLLSDAIAKQGSILAIGCFPSKIDGSLQPFGIVLPTSWKSLSKMRMDVWLHGRDEKTSEVGFLGRRRDSIGEFAPQDTVVLHPYGRYSNAFKFAGEVDVLEAIDFVQGFMPIDSHRISIRGFSMGGAGCWQIAAHFPDRWFAANPGAGFAETTEFLRLFQKEQFVPTPYQKKLLHLYDCPDWANNFRYLPLIVYSGEIDRQKQAADIMENALQSKGISMLHIVGPQTDHKFHPDSKIIIEDRLNSWSTEGRLDFPNRVDFTTYTLRYPSHSWIRLEELDEHWREARIQAEWSKGRIDVTTSNIKQFSIEIPYAKIAVDQTDVRIKVDGSEIVLERNQPSSDSLRKSFRRGPSGWEIALDPQLDHLTKRPGLQGPIDDAFLDSFCFVKPNLTTRDVDASAPVNRWLQAEYDHATREWKRHFRGDIIETTVAQLSASLEGNTESLHDRHRNWIVFGTPENNPLIAKVVSSLPIQWNAQEIVVGKDRYPAQDHVLAMIYPNPLQKDRYVVLNSGFTFREFAYLNNARQIPMLPDWAVIDIREGATSQLPGKIVAAGFFNEQWQLQDR